MATEKQIEANRANALKSTGPRTEGGKKSSSANALTHGLTAEMHLLPGEDPAAFADLRDKIKARYGPVAALEVELAERLASLAWRLRRIPAFEGAVLTWLSQDQGQSIGEALDLALSKNFFDKIARYEASLTNQFIWTEDELVDLISDRAQAELARHLAENPPQPPPQPTKITWQGRL